MQFVLRGDVSAVTVRRGARSKGRGLRVAQHFQRILNQVPVVIEHQDFRFQVRIAKRGTEIIRQDFGLLGRGENHARIVIGDVFRFVLHGDGVDGNAGGFSSPEGSRGRRRSSSWDSARALRGEAGGCTRDHARSKNA